MKVEVKREGGCEGCNNREHDFLTCLLCFFRLELMQLL